MTSPFTSAVVRCRQPEGCSAERLVASDAARMAHQLSGLGWSQQGDHGWVCPQHGSRKVVDQSPSTKLVVNHRTRALIQAIRDGHDFGRAIVRETGLSESTVYAILRRLRVAGWMVCELEPVEVAVHWRRPQRKIYRLTERLLDSLG